MTAINWIKCSDRMPPNDDTKIIIKDSQGTSEFPGRVIWEYYGRLFEWNSEWIPFDEATWKALNHDV